MLGDALAIAITQCRSNTKLEQGISCLMQQFKTAIYKLYIKYYCQVSASCKLTLVARAKDFLAVLPGDVRTSQQHATVCIMARGNRSSLLHLFFKLQLITASM